MKQYSALLLILLFPTLVAPEIRSLNRIATPSPVESTMRDDLKRLPLSYPVSQVSIKNAIKQLFAQWNQAGMPETLSEQFYDRDQMIDSIRLEVPNDARLRILSIGSGQTLSQHWRADADGNPLALVSRISVVVDAQIEFSDDSGLQVRRGISEYVIELDTEIGTDIGSDQW